MGNLLDQILGNADLKCAAGLAALPLIGPLGALACKDAIVERLPAKIPSLDSCAPGTPPEICEIGKGVTRAVFKAFRIFQDSHEQVYDSASKVEKLLRGVSGPLFGISPFFPIAVGLERFGYPILQDHFENVAPQVGSFAAEVLMSTAMFGAGALAARSLAKAAHKAAETQTKPTTYETLIEEIVPGALLFVNPLF